MKESRKPFFSLLLLSSLVVISCSKLGTSEQVARVGKAVLTKSELNNIIAANPASNVKPEQYISQWVNDELLYQAALGEGLHHDKQLLKDLEHYRRELLGRTYLDLVKASGVDVTQEEIKQVYEENLENFYRPVDEVRINHFVIDDKNSARRVRRILASGRSGADRKSIFSTYQVETVTVKRGALIQALDEAIFTPNPKRSVLGPISTEYGWHVIEVLERNKEGSFREIDEVYDELRHQLFQNYASINSIKILDSLRAATDIEINLEIVNQ